VDHAKLREILRRVRATYVFYTADATKWTNDATFLRRLQQAQDDLLEQLAAGGVQSLLDASAERVLTSLETAAVGLLVALNVYGLAYAVSLTARPLHESCPMRELMMSGKVLVALFTDAFIKAAEAELGVA
jgi:hypothetical protein